MSVGNRIKEFRKIKNMKQGELAELLGIPQSNLARYENDGVNFTAEKLKQFYNLGINVNWLLTGEGEIFLPQMIKNAHSDDINHINYNKDKDLIFLNDKELLINQEGYKDTIQIPLMDIKVSAGSGFVNYEEEVYQWISFPRLLIGHYDPDYLRLLQIDGRSMEPTIMTGDWILVAINEKRLMSEKIFVIKSQDEIRCKRLMQDSKGNITIMSDNPIFGKEELSRHDFIDYGVEIIGKVIKIIHNV